MNKMFKGLDDDSNNDNDNNNSYSNDACFSDLVLIELLPLKGHQHCWKIVKCIILSLWDHFSPATNHVKGLFVVWQQSLIHSDFDIMHRLRPHILIEWNTNSLIFQSTDLLWMYCQCLSLFPNNTTLFLILKCVFAAVLWNDLCKGHGWSSHWGWFLLILCLKSTSKCSISKF